MWTHWKCWEAFPSLHKVGRDEHAPCTGAPKGCTWGLTPVSVGRSSGLGATEKTQNPTSRTLLGLPWQTLWLEPKGLGLGFMELQNRFINCLCLLGMNIWMINVCIKMSVRCNLIGKAWRSNPPLPPPTSQRLFIKLKLKTVQRGQILCESNNESASKPLTCVGQESNSLVAVLQPLS